MPNNPTSYDLDTEPEFSFQKMIANYLQKTRKAFKSWKTIVICMLVAALLGIAYATVKSRTYTARLTFIVEDAKSTGGSMVSALAGQLGFDIAGMTGGNGMLAGDNVLELLSSPHFVKSTLLTNYDDSANNKTTLADEYAIAYHWKEKWKNNKEINKDIDFSVLKTKASRLEDSLIQVMILRITEKELNISKPDKKLDIFEIEATMRDERLTQLFCERLLKITSDFYVDTKTGRTKRNVERLQKRADSIGVLLNHQTYKSSSENTKLIDLNPAYTTSGVTAEISARDKLVLSTIYTEVVKNLEVSRTALMQETPTVQIIDHPELPLKLNRVKWPTGLLIGAILGFATSLIWLIFLKNNDD